MQLVLNVYTEIYIQLTKFEMELTFIPWYRHTVNKHKDNLAQVIFYYLNWQTHRIYKLHTH